MRWKPSWKSWKKKQRLKIAFWMVLNCFWKSNKKVLRTPEREKSESLRVNLTVAMEPIESIDNSDMNGNGIIIWHGTVKKCRQMLNNNRDCCRLTQVLSQTITLAVDTTLWHFIIYYEWQGNPSLLKSVIEIKDWESRSLSECGCLNLLL